jgi:hypothetical protein
MDKVVAGNLHTVEDVRFLQCYFLSKEGHKTIPNDKWTFVDGRQSWFKLAPFG